MREIRVFKSDKYRYVGVYQDDIFQQGFYEKAQTGIPLEGDIYLGRIESFDKSRKNGFVNIKCGKNAILPLKGKSDIKIGDTIACEVIRGEKDLKGAKVSLSYTLPGKYVILRNSRKKIALTRSIKREDIKDQLWECLKGYSKEFSGEISVRSAIVECPSKEALIGDIEGLIGKFNDIHRKGEHSSVIGKLHDSGGILGRIERSEGAETRIIHVDEVEKDGSFQVADFIGDVVQSYKRVVELPSGGSMVIDKTEAMYTIDINSGGGDRRKVNDDNAEFICREILRRNLNGIILVDFINFDDKGKIEPLAEKISRIMNRDSVKGRVYFNKDLGLVEIARNRKGLTLYEVLDSVEEGLFKKNVVIEKEEVISLIKNMTKNVYEAIRKEKNKGEKRVIIKLNPHFYGEIEKELDRLRSKKLQYAPDLTVSYNSEFILGYSYY